MAPSINASSINEDNTNSITQAFHALFPGKETLSNLRTSISRRRSSSSNIKVLLLENLHVKGVSILEQQGFSVECHAKSLSDEELCEKIKDVHVIGIRSKTKITAQVLSHAKCLLAIGCFCIGTNQVDLKAAEMSGIPVFNSPYANSRSVAELIICQTVSLARQLGDRNRELHEGVWNKVSCNSFEIRGKTLGIIGYGHIGTQVSVLAESMGLHVIFYDIVPKLALGNAIQKDSIEDVLRESDFLTLHVPALNATEWMIGAKEIALMRPGAYLLNASRGNVVVLDDLATALQEGRLGGAYVDVYPSEPKGNGPGFETPLQNCKNVLLTPHIGGSTEEAQAAIGIEVASKLCKFVNEGSTNGAVNFPNVEMPRRGTTSHRILNVHKNVPGVLRDINSILECNVMAQTLGTRPDGVGYLIVDVDIEHEIKEKMDQLSNNISTRILW